MPVVLGAASAITSRRVAVYGALSTIAAVAIVVNAFRQRSNFYAATVMLGGSNGCMMVLLNFAFFLSLCVGRIGQKILFGDLRAVEVEHLHERLWYAITESLLAMTIFRDDFDASFAILFVTLLFLKVFHWLSADRVEYMEQSPSVGRLFHLRMITVLSMLFEFDLFLATFAVEVLIVDQQRKGIMIMFSSEFFILGATLWSTIAKYLINCQDMRSEEPWQAKSMYVFFVDLVTDFLKLATYVACFCLILSYYGLPLNIIRDVYMTGRSFFGRLRDFIQYRAATRNMDTRFPDASWADLRSMSDGTCIICREEMIAREGSERNVDAGDAAGSAQAQQQGSPPPVPSSGLNETPKKLPCGHIFHFHCLRSWLERQQSCPTCRRTVFTVAPDFGPARTAAMPPNDTQREADLWQQQGNGHAAVALAQENLPPTGGDRQEGDNTRFTARERLQRFLSQLQTDAQRLREEHRQRTAPSTRTVRAQDHSSADTNTHTSTSNGAQGGSANSLNSSAAAESSRSPARRMLVNSLFAHRDVLTARRRDAGLAEGSSTTSLPPPPIAQGLTRTRSDRYDDLQASWIPPAPWTMRSRGREVHGGNPASHVSDSAPRSTTTEAMAPTGGLSPQLRTQTARSETHLPSAEDEKVDKTLEKDNKSAGQDPADAREAARAAALRRFAAQRASVSSKVTRKPEAEPNLLDSSSPTVTTALTGSTKYVEQQQQHMLPGNPHLIPLFDPSFIDDFEKSHTSHLPFPLLDNASAHMASNNVRSAFSEELSSFALSAADLEGLSKQTRKGLEERLRLLYRVEGAVVHLVEELTRALSVLPVDDSILHTSTTSDATAAAAASSLDSSVVGHVQAKGKEPAEGLRAAKLEHDTDE